MKTSRDYLIEKCEFTKIPEIKYGFEISKIMEEYAKEYHKEQLNLDKETPINDLEKPSMEEILNEAQRRKAKHSVQYDGYSLDTWTVANDLLEHRKNALLNDSSVRKVRIEYEM